MFALDMSAMPFVTMTGKVSERPGWSHSGRSMNTNLLVVFHGGACTFEIGAQRYAYSKGDVALVPRGTLYRPHTDHSSEYTFFHFEGELVPCAAAAPAGENADDAPFTKPMYGYIEKADTRLLFDYRMSVEESLPQIELLLSRCRATQRTGEGNAQLLVSIQFSELLFHISRAYCAQFERESAQPATLQKILRYIQENYTHGISLADLQRHTGLSKQYCMRLFKEHMHMTINDYILDMRMRHAVYLLRHTYMNVNQTADYLGFSSVSYFSRVFKRYYGIPPSEYFA